ncbi:ribbon-helix-helix protein, CopG family [Mycobacterium sp.]|uniref:ribbon-helix-helix protein, CopG family n=1 Tax=Mycobacterium sp. TaxID=1785 RepID=UPI003A8BBB33
MRHRGDTEAGERDHECRHDCVKYCAPGLHVAVASGHGYRHYRRTGGSRPACRANAAVWFPNRNRDEILASVPPPKPKPENSKLSASIPTDLLERFEKAADAAGISVAAALQDAVTKWVKKK